MNEKDAILIIDDDEQLSDVLSVRLESEGFRTVCCSEPDGALEQISQGDFSLVLLDLKLGNSSGLDLLPVLRELDPAIPILMITAHGDVDSAVAAFKSGANGYIRKPFRDGELREQVNQAIDGFRLKRMLRSQPGHVARSEEVRSWIKSRDPAMDSVYRRITMAAQVTSNVVIFGESGTGKELVARALHRGGPRKQGPFVAFNCAAIPETLMESELFGHMRGAFTDARDNKPGLFARANGGTLFIDEIGDAPASIQAKLLRVLQEKEVLPLGGTAPLKVDVRVVAATHKNLLAEVEAGRFRADLYYRMHVIPIRIPPLRERPRDILLLAILFANRLASDMKVPFEGFTVGAEAALEAHGWPGNVRELQNRIEHAFVISGGGCLPASSLFPEKAAKEDGPVEGGAGSELESREPAVPEALPTFFEAKNSFERSYLEKVLSLAKGNIARAAKLASKSRTEVYSMLRKHGLDPGTFKGQR